MLTALCRPTFGADESAPKTAGGADLEGEKHVQDVVDLSEQRVDRLGERRRREHYWQLVSRSRPVAQVLYDPDGRFEQRAAAFARRLLATRESPPAGAVGRAGHAQCLHVWPRAVSMQATRLLMTHQHAGSEVVPQDPVHNAPNNGHWMSLGLWFLNPAEPRRRESELPVAELP